MKKFNTGVARIKNSDGKYVMLPALRGATSYEVAVRNGFKGTEDDWLSMMIDNGWVTKCQELDVAKADKDDVYTKDETDSLASNLNKDLLTKLAPIPPYLTFVGNVNADMVSAAFGKGNEDEISGIGKALAMYGWYKGNDKTEYPFIYLQNMQTLNDADRNACNEIINSDHLSVFTMGNIYARDKLFEMYTADASFNNAYGNDTEIYDSVKTTDIVINDEDLLYPFRLSYTVGYTGSNNVSAYVYINDVLVDKIVYTGNSAAANNSNDKTLILKNWSDYGISTPGTYTIKARGVEVQDSYPANAIVTSKIILYKLKQSYDI